EGETVLAFVTKPATGAKHTTIFMRKADGTEVLAGSLWVDQDAARPPTALEARLKDLSALAQPVVLRDIAVGMTSPRMKVVMGPISTWAPSIRSPCPTS